MNSISADRDHSTQRALDYAREQGLQVVVPKNDELLIDIDSDAAYHTFESNYPLVAGLYPTAGYQVSPSRTKPEGKHIHLQLGCTLNPFERVALQCILGSDLHRELYSVERIRNGEVAPTLFYEKPVEAVKQ